MVKTASKLFRPNIKLTDLIAGLSISGLLLPEAVAYSGIANLPPQAGIIALFAGLVCYAIFGTSRFAIVSATSSSAAVMAAAIASLSNGDMGLGISLSIGLIFATGIFFLLAALTRMGSVTDFIAKPVLRGFAFGLVLVIIVKQFASVVGIHGSSGNFFVIVHTLLKSILAWNIWGFSIMLLSLAVLSLLSRFKHIPGGLLVIAGGIILSSLMDLSPYNIKLVGSINLHLSVPSIPELSQGQWAELIEISLALAMVIYSESYGSIRTFAMKYGDAVSPNRDLFALGISNIVSSLFHGMPVGAGFSATSANDAAGATSKWSGVITAFVVLCIVLVLLPTIALTPEPILAAIVIHAVSHTLQPNNFKSNFVLKRDRLVVITSITGVLVLGVVDGLLFAIAISIFMLLRRFSESTISILGRLGNGHDFVILRLHKDAHIVPGIAIFRADQPLFFANSERMLNQAHRYISESKEKIHSVILSLEESSDLDSTTVENIGTFAEYITKQNKILVVARLKEQAFEVLSLYFQKGSEQIILTELSVDDAVQQAEVIMKSRKEYSFEESIN